MARHGRGCRDRARTSVRFVGVMDEGAALANVVGLPQTVGNVSTLYNANADSTGTFFDPVAAGWTLVAVPEPSTALLMSLGLIGLSLAGRKSIPASSRSRTW
ncbi:MAG: PEP-CTERM sorting domain-containing protein [Myxococcales bacterium]|nr:PEP-CTERM sorting domain-containing protein [Myxococcales bacterium]HIM03172.1 PEP-CTERM sorting domain-containing protein [Myxococcales bacterium]